MAESRHMSVRLRKETLDRLDSLAKQTKRSRSYLVAEAVENLVEENAWQIEEIGKAVRKADAGGPFVKHQDMTAWLKSWGSDEELPPPRASVTR
jgi:predicted transcriptional regulator